MRRTRAAAVVITLAPCLLALNGCGLGVVGDVFGEREPVIYVRNDTTSTFYAGATDYADGEAALGEDIEPRAWAGVTWAGCKTSWLVLRKRENPTSQEVARFELTLCSGDDVIVAPDYGITIECRERIHVMSEPDC
jgi:hypothetical protein